MRWWVALHPSYNSAQHNIFHIVCAHGTEDSGLCFHDWPSAAASSTWIFNTRCIYLKYESSFRLSVDLLPCCYIDSCACDSEIVVINSDTPSFVHSFWFFTWYRIFVINVYALNWWNFLRIIISRCFSEKRQHRLLTIGQNINIYMWRHAHSFDSSMH